jgi:hypothetical protein
MCCGIWCSFSVIDPSGGSLATARRRRGVVVGGVLDRVAGLTGRGARGTRIGRRRHAGFGLFAQPAGLLVEHGSLLSHSAIVSRELGLPSIVAIPGLTSWLRSGDLVEFDGAAGTVRRLEPTL